jgi:hypothetical protein
VSRALIEVSWLFPTSGVSKLIVFQAGIIERGSMFREFLDGLQEVDPLVSVCDVGGKYGASSKIKGRSRLTTIIDEEIS